MAEKRQSDIDTPEETDNAPPTKIPFLRQLLDHAGITPEVEHWHYDGSGTEADPYVVTWTENDPRNPMLYPDIRKWCITFLVSFITMAVAFCSSAYSGGGASVIADFHCSEELFILGLSLFVLGFALGPLLWAPLSELFGRQVLFALTGLGLTAFNAGAAGSQNIATLSVLRFFAGAIGSSPITNAGGVLADLFNNEQRGLALSLFAAAPFLGPILGPIAGGFIGQTVGWRWIEGVMAILTGVLWLLGLVGLPETYAPVLLRTRARQLSKKTGKVYRTRHDIDQGSGSTSMRNSFNKALLRPWILLFREPIVLLLTIYMAIIYGTLYLLFGAFPIVYQQDRGWSPGIGGLAFIGVLVGMVFAIAFILWDNKRYTAISKQHGGFAPPESRLPPCLIASVLFPISLFWFAWTNGNDVHWAVSYSPRIRKTLTADKVPRCPSSPLHRLGLA